MCLGMWALAAGEVSAQDMKLVSGRIVNKNTKKPFGQEAVFIYAFNTVAEAEDARKVIDSKNGFFESSSMEAASADGYYQITVPETGALIFKVGVVDCVLEKVNYRLEINVEIESNEILKQVDVVGMRQGIQPMDPDNAEIDGNSFRARNKIPIPAQYGKSNARLILQPYLLDGNTGDTVRFLDPMVYDGEQYHLTQERRMGYDTGKDPLMHYVRHEPLVADGMVVDWADTVYLDDPMKSYCVKGVLLLEDYNRVYHREEYLLASARIRRPLKFLEYTLGERQLDPNKYKERPRRERRNTAGNISQVEERFAGDCGRGGVAIEGVPYPGRGFAGRFVCIESGAGEKAGAVCAGADYVGVATAGAGAGISEPEGGGGSLDGGGGLVVCRFAEAGGSGYPRHRGEVSG